MKCKDQRHNFGTIFLILFFWVFISIFPQQKIKIQYKIGCPWLPYPSSDSPSILSMDSCEDPSKHHSSGSSWTNQHGTKYDCFEYCVPRKLYLKGVHSASDWMYIKSQTMGETTLNNFMEELNLQFRERKKKTKKGRRMKSKQRRIGDAVKLRFQK